MRNRVEQRAEMISTFLVKNLGKGFTRTELLEAVGIHDGATTTSAMKRAREMITARGLHFPPAIARDGHRYKVTGLPGDALDPALQMARLEAGVRARKNDGIEFMRKRLHGVPTDMRPIARAFVNIEQKTERALAELRHEADEMIVEMVKLRRRDHGN